MRLQRAMAWPRCRGARTSPEVFLLCNTVLSCEPRRPRMGRSVLNSAGLHQQFTRIELRLICQPLAELDLTSSTDPLTFAPHIELNFEIYDGTQIANASLANSSFGGKSGPGSDVRPDN